MSVDTSVGVVNTLCHLLISIVYEETWWLRYVRCPGESLSQGISAGWLLNEAWEREINSVVDRLVDRICLWPWVRWKVEVSDYAITDCEVNHRVCDRRAVDD